MTPFAPSPPPFLYTTYHDETGIRFSFVPLFLPPFRPENDDSIPNGGGLCLRDRLDLKDLEFFFPSSAMIKYFQDFPLLYTRMELLIELLIENGQFKFPFAIVAKPSTSLIPICELTMTPTHDSLLNRELFAALALGGKIPQGVSRCNSRKVQSFARPFRRKRVSRRSNISGHV